ncbi:MAG: pyridoxine 5'-phosphate synthase [Deltaproteobacteria bacterium]|nr:pyridoxine 5'-phosphate synthase [Deltaproteobacteria bacterium]
MPSKVLLPRLGVNIDHVATLRQARRAVYPQPSWAATLAELGGADQITLHLREDRRHIQDEDLFLLRKSVNTRLNLEMAATDEMLRIAFETKPDMVTLVPERRQELTTEGGLDVSGNKDHIKRIVSELKNADIHVSLFVDPDLNQVQTCHRVGADAVELHTGRYCDTKSMKESQEEYTRLVHAAKTAVKTKLRCYAGHGIHYNSVGDIAAILEVEELNIGHSIVARAVLVGMEQAVRDMKETAQAARRDALLLAKR